MNRYVAVTSLFLTAALVGCGDDSKTPPPGGDTTKPTVTSTVPSTGATAVATNGSISVTFSEAMDPASLTPATFKVAGGAAVPGTVTYTGLIATFHPASVVAVGTLFTATVTTGVKDLAGNALAVDRVWSFTTASVPHASLPPVLLGSAGNFVILAKTGVSTVTPSVVTGDVGVSPAAATYITGFSLIADATNVFSTSSQVNGKLYAADYTPPTPNKMTTAVSDMEAAYTDAAGRTTPDFLEFHTGAIGGLTLAPGLYTWTSTVTIPSDVTISGSATDVWIFQTSGDLTMASATKVTLAGGALAKNIFWQVAGQVTIGTTAHFEGVILSQTAINLQTGSSMKGRALAQSAVTLDSATVTQPAL